MGTNPEKVENSILAILGLYPEFKAAGSIVEWCNRIETRLGERATQHETVAALKRLRDRGLVQLVNYSRAPWWEYVKGETIDEHAFFYIGSFSVVLTAAGRAQDVPRDLIGFRKTA